MPQQTVTIESLPMALAVVKEMQTNGLDWGGSYRPLARRALAEVIESQMALAVDRHLEDTERENPPDRRSAHLCGHRPDRRNGCYRRRLLTGLGDIEIRVPRTRHWSPCAMLRAYARREAEVDRVILAGFVLGLSTRKLGEALLPLLGRPVSPVSPQTVSRVARTLDSAVAAFHARPLDGRYRALILDGVVLSRKTGAGALKRPVLVALGLRHDGRKEILDFRLSGSESTAEWERFLNDLYRRGLDGAQFEMICVDGGKGLLAALRTVYPYHPVQRCWAHKIRNLLDKVRKTDQDDLKAGLHAIMNAKTERAARSAARRFADRWEPDYPRVIASLREDLDDLLTCMRYKTLAERKAVRTTNAIERRFREVRRRTRPMGVFQDRTSMDRILYAVFNYENKSQGTAAPFLMTHNS